MKLNCSAKLFRETLAIATRGIGGKSAMPVLDCVLIKTTPEGRVVIKGTDLDLSIESSFAAEVKEQGSICIPGKRTQSIVSALPLDECKVDVSARLSMSLKSGGSHFKIMGIDEKEFPVGHELSDAAEELVFKQADLLTILTCVAPAQSADETRYILNGVYVNRTDKGFSFVATDGRRMHLNKASAQAGGATIGAIIPSRAIDLILSLLDEEGTVTMLLEPKRVRVTISRVEGDIVVVSKVVEGNYPNFNQVIPKGRDTKITVKRQELVDAVSRCALALDEKHTAVKFKVDGAFIALEAISPEGGEANEMVACVNSTNAAPQFSANYKMILDALKSVSVEELILSLDDKSAETGAIMFDAGADCKLVVMPVRLS